MPTRSPSSRGSSRPRSTEAPWTSSLPAGGNRSTRAWIAAARDSGTPVSPAASARRYSTTLSECPAVRASTSVGVGGQAGRRGERLDRRRRQRVESQPDRAVGEPGHRRLVLAAHRTDEEDTRSGQPAGQVAEQVDGGRTSVLQVVDCQEERSPAREPAEDGHDRVVRTAALDRRRRRRLGSRLDELARAREAARPTEPVCSRSTSARSAAPRPSSTGRRAST